MFCICSTPTPTPPISVLDPSARMPTCKVCSVDDALLTATAVRFNIEIGGAGWAHTNFETKNGCLIYFRSKFRQLSGESEKRIQTSTCFIRNVLRQMTTSMNTTQYSGSPECIQPMKHRAQPWLKRLPRKRINRRNSPSWAHLVATVLQSRSASPVPEDAAGVEGGGGV